MGPTNAVNGFNEIKPTRLVGCTYELVTSSCITDDDSTARTLNKSLDAKHGTYTFVLEP